MDRRAFRLTRNSWVFLGFDTEKGGGALDWVGRCFKQEGSEEGLVGRGDTADIQTCTAGVGLQMPELQCHWGSKDGNAGVTNWQSASLKSPRLKVTNS